MGNRLLVGFAVALVTFVASACDSPRQNCRQRVEREWGDICADFAVVGTATAGSSSTRVVADAYFLMCLQSVVARKKCDSESDIPDSA
jgi:hypothetical protein